MQSFVKNQQTDFSKKYNGRTFPFVIKWEKDKK